MRYRQRADVVRLAASLRNYTRSALPYGGTQDERDAETVAPAKWPARHRRRSERLLPRVGSVPAAALHQLGMQVFRRRSHTRTALDAVLRGGGMRTVVLCSSVYSETACAMTVRLAQSECVP